MPQVNCIATASRSEQLKVMRMHFQDIWQPLKSNLIAQGPISKRSKNNHYPLRRHHLAPVCLSHTAADSLLGKMWQSQLGPVLTQCVCVCVSLPWPASSQEQAACHAGCSTPSPRNVKFKSDVFTTDKALMAPFIHIHLCTRIKGFSNLLSSKLGRSHLIYTLGYYSSAIYMRHIDKRPITY